MPAKNERGFTRFSVDAAGEKAAGDVEILMDVLAIIALPPAAGVLVAGGTAGVFAHAGLRVDAQILPMTVAANDDHVFLFRDERAQLIPFVGENFVGMIVAFIVAVRPDDGCGADEHAEGGV